MIKRRFYNLEHHDKDDNVSSSSSSSDDSDFEETEGYGDEEVTRVEQHETHSASISAGDVSDDGFGNNADVDSNGDNEVESENDSDGALPAEGDDKVLKAMSKLRAFKEPVLVDAPEWIMRYKSVFKCRLCPTIVCLNEESVNTHVKSKRHARSEKLYEEGRLKHMLDSDGEVEEEDGETHAERHARLLALLQDEEDKPEKEKKKMFKKVRQLDGVRLSKKNKGSNLNNENTKQSPEKPANKRHKNENTKQLEKANQSPEKPAKKSLKNENTEQPEKAKQAPEKPARKRPRNKNSEQLEKPAKKSSENKKIRM